MPLKVGKGKIMGPNSLTGDLDEHVGRAQSTVEGRTAILEQLEHVVQSAHFRLSKRYPSLLSFIVREALAGRTDSLKERTIGVEVFGRPADYDTYSDPIVRVAAGEVRKRIAQYYQSPGHENELRFELPLGSYIPRFLPPLFGSFLLEADSGESGADEHHAASDNTVELSRLKVELTSEPPESQSDYSVTAASSPTPDKSARKWKIAFIITLASGLFGAMVLTLNALKDERQQMGVSFFWNPLLSSRQPVLVVVGVHSLDRNGKDISPATYASMPKEPQTMLSSMIRTDMVSVGDVISYSRITDLLSRHARDYRTQSAAETTLDELRRGPIILIGGFDNLWTMRLTSELRFRLVAESASIQDIQDIANPTVSWKFDNSQSAMSSSRDYAIVGSFFDPQIDQQIVFVAGIGQSGTAAGAEFLTDNNYLLTWMAHSGFHRHQNVEIVLSTEIIEGQHEPPKVVATYVW
jgi:hypothetical protein